MDDRHLRRRFHDAIGDEHTPPELAGQTRASLKRQIEAGQGGPPQAAAIAAVLLVVAILSSLLAVGIVRWSHGAATTTPGQLATPSQTASPSQNVRTAKVYIQGSAGWRAVDWAGGLHGTIGSAQVGMPIQSPDGSRLIWEHQGIWQMVDSAGKVLLTPDLSRSREFTWADDSSGICVVNVNHENPPNGGSYELDFYSVNGGRRQISSVTTDKGPNIAACSAARSRVVIATASGKKDPVTGQFTITFGELDVIDFTSGSVLSRQQFPTGTPSAEVRSIAVSHDGSFAAVATQSQMRIYELADHKVVAQVFGLAPLAFSWDDQLIVAIRPTYHAQVLRVSTGQVVWSDPVSRSTQGAVGNPGGSDVMLVTTGGRLYDLVVVSSTGSSKVIAADVLPDQIAPCTNCSAF
jgi:hypothetical protein